MIWRIVWCVSAYLDQSWSNHIYFTLQDGWCGWLETGNWDRIHANIYTYVRRVSSSFGSGINLTIYYYPSDGVISILSKQFLLHSILNKAIGVPETFGCGNVGRTGEVDSVLNNA